MLQIIHQWISKIYNQIDFNLQLSKCHLIRLDLFIEDSVNAMLYETTKKEKIYTFKENLVG